jgi:hypothetical protein
MPWAPAVKRASSETSSSARRQLPHPGHAGQRHGCARGARCGRSWRLPMCAGQWAAADGNENLSLSRPFDVGPGQISQPRGSSGRAREHRDPIEGQEADMLRKAGDAEDEIKAIDKDDQARSWPKRPILPKARPNRSPPNSIPTCWWGATDGNRDQDAGAVAHDGGRHARQMAGQGRAMTVKGGGHDRRDRDRQGDDGIRSSR